jgi:hypothetical protein
MRKELDFKWKTFILIMLVFGSKCVIPSEENTTEYNLLNLKSFWRGFGPGIIYPGKILLTSDKLKEQRSLITTHEPFDLSDHFVMTININFHVNNKESRQSAFIAFSTADISTQGFNPVFNLLPISENFSGFIVYIKNYDTMHVGAIDSTNFNENELLSRAKVCKISQRENGFFSFQIAYTLGKISVQLKENQDGSFRPCAQFSSFKFNYPMYISAGGADDFGFTESIIRKEETREVTNSSVGHG